MLNRNVITVKGGHKAQNKTKNSASYRSQAFSQSFTLPKDADKDNIQADFENQVLTIAIPKLDKPVSEQKEIKIN